MWWFRRSVRRFRAQLVTGVEATTAALDAERRLPAEQRTTGASTDSVLDTVHHAADAWKQLSWGDDVGAALAVRRLAAEARGWSPDSSLTASLGDLGTAAEELLGRRPDDPRLAPSVPSGPLHPADPRLEPQPSPTSEFLLPAAESFPAVLEHLHAGEGQPAIKEYRAATGVGLRDAHAAVEYAARRLGLALDP